MISPALILFESQCHFQYQIFWLLSQTKQCFKLFFWGVMYNTTKEGIINWKYTRIIMTEEDRIWMTNLKKMAIFFKLCGSLG